MARPRGHLTNMASEKASSVHLRDLGCELGLLQRADGSARVSQGKTSVICAVYGPAEVKINKEQCDQATLDVIIKPESGMSTPRERLMEELVTSCCKSTVQSKLHPHTALSITLQVENDDGMLLATMINACCLALLDACVPMTTVFAAVTCGYSEDGDLLTDLTPQTEEKGKVWLQLERYEKKRAAVTECESVLTFVTDDSTGNIITSYAIGAFSIEQLQQALGVTQEASKTVTAFYRQSIKRKLSKDVSKSSLDSVV